MLAPQWECAKHSLPIRGRSFGYAPRLLKARALRSLFAPIVVRLQGRRLPRRVSFNLPRRQGAIRFYIRPGIGTPAKVVISIFSFLGCS